MKNIIFLKSNFDDTKLWGGHKLLDYGYLGTSDKIGEAYLISGLKACPSLINDLEIQETNLYDFYNSHKDWFNNYEGEYPLLSKLIDAKEDLSVQVHPNNEYALKKFNKLGKTECWYIMDCPKDNDIIFGLNSHNIDDVKQAISSNQWDEVLNVQKTNPEDVLFIPSGTVHAIKKDTFLFEIQQSSDLTFRLYDYDRVDDQGHKRELHLEDSLNVINFHQTHAISKVTNNIMISCEYFTTEIYDINEIQRFQYDNVYWVEVVILDLEFGWINGSKLEKGVSMLVHSETPFTITGKAKIAITYIKR